MKFRTILLAILVIFLSISMSNSDDRLPTYGPGDELPAGRHGFVIIRNGLLLFEDGTTAKFSGINVHFGLPDKKRAFAIASRLSALGFNAIRLRDIDLKQVDKLDYFIYALKEHGIYIDLRLFVTIKPPAKPALVFDPALIQRQKQYARDLLGHYNPYTKLKYCNEPAICLIEIANVNSVYNNWVRDNLNGPMFGICKNAIPTRYSKMLDDKWNHWLMDRYETASKVKDAWLANCGLSFSRETDFITDPANWTIELQNNASAYKDTANNQTIITIAKADEVPWHIQYKYCGIPLSKGHHYMVKFTAKCMVKKFIMAAVCQQNYGPWGILGLAQTITLNEDYRTFEMPFAATDDCQNSKLTLILGYGQGRISLKDVSLKEITSSKFAKDNMSPVFSFPRPIYKFINLYPKNNAADIITFYRGLENTYFETMCLYLKDELDIKAPIVRAGCDSLPGAIRLVDPRNLHGTPQYRTDRMVKAS